MGKGDLRSKRGKIFRGTYGNTRRRKKHRTASPKVETVAPAARRTPPQP